MPEMRVKNIWRSQQGETPIVSHHENKYQALFELWSKQNEYDGHHYKYFATEYSVGPINDDVIFVEDLMVEIDDFRDDLQKQAELDAAADNYHIQQESRQDLYI